MRVPGEENKAIDTIKQDTTSIFEIFRKLSSPTSKLCEVPVFTVELSKRKTRSWVFGEECFLSAFLVSSLFPVHIWLLNIYTEKPVGQQLGKSRWEVPFGLAMYIYPPKTANCLERLIRFQPHPEAISRNVQPTPIPVTTFSPTDLL